MLHNRNEGANKNNLIFQYKKNYKNSNIFLNKYNNKNGTSLDCILIKKATQENIHNNHNFDDVQNEDPIEKNQQQYKRKK